MKKALFLFSTVLLFSVLFASCKTDEITVKKNWIFTITSVTTYTPDITEAGPQTMVSTIEKNGLTEVEAEAVVKEMTTTQTMTQGDITIKMTVTVTKAEKK